MDLIERVGSSRAVRSYQLCLDAVGGIEDLAGECGWRSTRSLYLASRRRDRRALERERLARRAAGIEVEYLTERDIRQRFSFTRPAALLSPVGGEVDASAWRTSSCMRPAARVSKSTIALQWTSA